MDVTGSNDANAAANTVQDPIGQRSRAVIKVESMSGFRQT